MIKKMNIIFFGICFLAAMLAEGYCIRILKGDLLSTVGVGLVVLITGYLFMDSVRDCIKKRSEFLQFYVDRILREETDRWNERCSEITYIQKATYSAVKKNTEAFSKQIEVILQRMEDMENSYSRELQLIAELQKRSLEGQKNSLKMQIHYDKENTKQLLNALYDEENKNGLKDQITEIIDLLKANKDLLNDQSEQLETYGENKIIPTEDMDVQPDDEGMIQNSDMLSAGMQPEEEILLPSEDTDQEVQADNSSSLNEPEPSVNVTPLYNDPNKELSADEIAALFASVGR